METIRKGIDFTLILKLRHHGLARNYEDPSPLAPHHELVNQNPCLQYFPSPTTSAIGMRCHSYANFS